MQSNHAWYRGCDFAALNSELARILNKAMNGRVVIVISCHGDENGNFIDNGFLWTPNALWNGHQQFIGLHNLIQACHARRIDIVLSQCHGKHFGDKLHEIITIFMLRRVYVHGLSYNETNRRYLSVENDAWLTTQHPGDWETGNPNLRVNDGETWKLSTREMHVSLVQWFAKNVPAGLGLE